MTGPPVILSLLRAFHLSSTPPEEMVCLYNEAKGPPAKHNVHTGFNELKIQCTTEQGTMHIVLSHTKNWLAALTVGVSGNLRDIIPGGKKSLMFLYKGHAYYFLHAFIMQLK